MVQPSHMELRSGQVVGGHLLSVQAQPAFEEGIKLLFRRWTALNLAVENQWGGANSAEKANYLVEDTIEWFRLNKEHYWDDLEEMLSDALLQDFNTEAEDGSPEQVAKAAVDLYKQCLQEDFSTVLRWRADAERISSRVRASQRQVVDRDGTLMGEDDDSSDDDGGDMDMDDVAPQAIPISRPEPVVDEDGFTLVQGKGRRGQPQP